ncbi:MAG: MerR family transcriptional regulator, partial [Alphaproteobacteria bacterium]
MSNSAHVSGRRGGKSAEAFRTISEVASDLDVPQHVLRFWETKFNQVRPMKRGGGRRYYRPEDVDLLRSIRSLLYDDGYTIKGVQKLLREGGLRPFYADDGPAAPVA